MRECVLLFDSIPSLFLIFEETLAAPAPAPPRGVRTYVQLSLHPSCCCYRDPVVFPPSPEAY
jgi:hypothetical protein